MHVNFDAVCQGDSKFAHETSKTQSALISSIFSEERTRHFDALTHNLFFCAYSGLQNTLKYIKLIYVFGSVHVKIGVWIKAGPQPLFLAEPGVKNG